MTTSGAAGAVSASTQTQTMQRLIRDFIEPEARIAGLRGALRTQQRDIERQVLEHRSKIVTKFVRNLWDRYKRDIKRRDIEMSFAAWLIEKGDLENTFAEAKKHQHGFTLERRLRWVKFTVDRIMHRSTSLKDEERDYSWFVDDATLELQKKQPESGLLVRVAIAYPWPVQGRVTTIGFMG